MTPASSAPRVAHIVADLDGLEEEYGPPPRRARRRYRAVRWRVVFRRLWKAAA